MNKVFRYIYSTLFKAEWLHWSGYLCSRRSKSQVITAIMPGVNSVFLEYCDPFRGVLRVCELVGSADTIAVSLGIQYEGSSMSFLED